MRSLVMLIAVAAAYASLSGYPQAWPELVRVCVSVLALFMGIGLWGRRLPGDGPVARPRRAPGWMDYVGIGAAVLAVECLFLVFLSASPTPLESAAVKLETWLKPEAARERLEEELESGSGRQGNWLWDREGKRELPQRANYKPGNRPEVFLQVADERSAGRLLETRIYVHSFGLGAYREDAWAPVSGEGGNLVAAADGWLRLEEGRQGEELLCRVFHGRETHGQNPVTGLQGRVEARLPEAKRVADGLELLPAIGEESVGYEYDVISKPVRLDELAGSGAGVPSDVAAGYLDLPGGALGFRIADLARIAGGEGTAVERLLRIRNHLRTTLDYSLVIENPDNRDPLENFLFHEQRGHCEFFATAGALLARASGVPSRVVYGWAGGTYYETSGLFVFRAGEAHAWAEVMLEGQGWVVFDPTPPGELDRVLAERAPAGEEVPDIAEAGEEAAEAEPFPVRRFGQALALVFGVFALAVLMWRFRRRRVEERLGSLTGGVSTGPYLESFVRACRRRGVETGPGETLRMMAGGLEGAPGFVDELVRYHYRVRYEGGQVDEKRERELREKVEAWG